jgi:hypothetical protein
MQIHADLVAATATRLVAAGLVGGRVERDRDRPTQDQELPLAVVHVLEDRLSHDGHSGTGIPAFNHSIKLCVDVFTSGANGAAAKGQLYTAAELIVGTLLSDPTWLGLIDGVEQVALQYMVPEEQSRRSLSAVNVEFVVSHRSRWTPIAPALPDLARVVISGPADLSAIVDVPTT